jgi:polyvinyl alcohol dehydrogenase (cytochrome)
VAPVVALGGPNEWPSYGADLANSRTVTGGPAATAVGALHEVWRVDFSDGDFTGTPIVAGGVAYVGSNGGVVRAIQAVPIAGHDAGSVLWSATVSGPVNASLALAGGIVYVPVATQASPSVVALDAATGRQLWASVLDTSTDASSFGSPTVAPDPTGRLVVLQGVSATSGDPASPLRGSVSALDAASGNVVWKSFMVPEGTNGGAVWSTPAVDVATGTVYVGTGNAYTGTAAPTTDAIVALDIRSGAILRSFQATSNDDFSSSTPGLDFDFGASPNLITTSDGRRLVGEGQKAGTYWALDRDSMQQVWHTQIGPGSVVGGILGSTAFDAGSQQVVGPVSLPGYVWSVNAGTGTPGWVTAAAADPAHLSPVAISNGVVYSVASGGFLEAWLEQTGTPLIELPLNNPATPTSAALALASGVSVADGLVVADTGSQGTNGSVVAFSTN